VLSLLDRARPRTHQPHPVDAAVALAQEGLLFHEERAVWRTQAVAVADALAVDNGVGIDGDQLLDVLVGLDPRRHNLLDHRVGVVGLPGAVRRERPEVDVRMQQMCDARVVLRRDRLGEGRPQGCGAVGHG
jgi:hypothetical protein